jgi:ankyrin repeat protein
VKSAWSVKCIIEDLNFICLFRNGKSVKLLIEASKCSVHVTDFMWHTPLHLACLSGNDLEQVKFLLDNGADPNAR